MPADDEHGPRPRGGYWASAKRARNMGKLLDFLRGCSSEVERDIIVYIAPDLGFSKRTCDRLLHDAVATGRLRVRRELVGGVSRAWYRLPERLYDPEEFIDHHTAVRLNRLIKSGRLDAVLPIWVQAAAEYDADAFEGEEAEGAGWGYVD